MFPCIILCRGSLHGYYFSAHWFSVRGSYFTQKFGDIFLAVYTRVNTGGAGLMVFGVALVFNLSEREKMMKLL